MEKYAKRHLLLKQNFILSNNLRVSPSHIVKASTKAMYVDEENVFDDILMKYLWKLPTYLISKKRSCTYRNKDFIEALWYGFPIELIDRILVYCPFRRYFWSVIVKNNCKKL